jgi:hypothetical protein
MKQGGSFMKEIIGPGLGGYEPPPLKQYPRAGTKKHAKFKAIERRAKKPELQKIDGRGGYGTYRNDTKQLARLLGKTPMQEGSGQDTEYWVE